MGKHPGCVRSVNELLTSPANRSGSWATGCRQGAEQVWQPGRLELGARGLPLGFGSAVAELPEQLPGAASCSSGWQGPGPLHGHSRRLSIRSGRRKAEGCGTLCACQRCCARHIPQSCRRREMWFHRFWKSPVSCFQPGFLKECRALSHRHPKLAPMLGPTGMDLPRSGCTWGWCSQILQI